MLVDMLLRLKSIIYLPGDFVVKKVSNGTHELGGVWIVCIVAVRVCFFFPLVPSCRATSAKRCTSSKAEQYRWWEDQTIALCLSL